jgi:hypothetical protein
MTNSTLLTSFGRRLTNTTRGTKKRKQTTFPFSPLVVLITVSSPSPGSKQRLKILTKTLPFRSNCKKGGLIVFSNRLPFARKKTSIEQKIIKFAQTASIVLGRNLARSGIFSCAITAILKKTLSISRF